MMISDGFVFVSGSRPGDYLTGVLLDADAAKAALAAQGCGEKGEGGVVRGGD